MSARTGGNVRKRLTAVALGAAGIVGGIGLLHAPFARSLLMRAGGCPFAGAKLTAAQADNGRHMGLRAERGTGSAPARPALGFTLDATSLAAARAWASVHRVTCESPREGLLHCADVPAGALGLAASDAPVAELALAFDPAGRLVNVTTYRARLDPGAASRAAKDIAARLQAALGPAPTTSGAFDADHLGQSPSSSIATLSYRYGDYVADVSAMNAPSGQGVIVREQYLSARD